MVRVCWSALRSRILASWLRLLTAYCLATCSSAWSNERLGNLDPDDQAEAYRKLAAKRAEDYGLPPPSPPEI